MSEQKQHDTTAELNPYTVRLLNMTSGKNFVDRLFNSLLDDIEQMIDTVRNKDYDNYCNFVIALDFYRIILINLCHETEAFQTLKKTQNLLLEKLAKS